MTGMLSRNWWATTLSADREASDAFAVGSNSSGSIVSGPG
jgi:hypothetical protein